MKLEITKKNYQSIIANREFPFDCDSVYFDTNTRELVITENDKRLYHQGENAEHWGLTVEQTWIMSAAIAKVALTTYHTISYWERAGFSDTLNYVVYDNNNDLEGIEQISVWHVGQEMPYVLAFYDMTGHLLNSIVLQITNEVNLREYIGKEYNIVTGVLADVYESKAKKNCSLLGISAFTDDVIVIGTMNGRTIKGPVELHDMVKGVYTYGGSLGYPLAALAEGTSRFAFGGSFVYTSDANLGSDMPLKLYDRNMTYENNTSNRDFPAGAYVDVIVV